MYVLRLTSTFWDTYYDIFSAVQVLCWPFPEFYARCRKLAPLSSQFEYNFKVLLLTIQNSVLMATTHPSKTLVISPHLKTLHLPLPFLLTTTTWTSLQLTKYWIRLLIAV